MYLDKEEWEKASDNYLLLEKSFANSYLAQEALFKAALCQEELGNYSEAVKFYTRFTEKYKKSPRIPHAYFSIGRIGETIGNHGEAVRIYNILKLDYSFSDWTSLAINRILDLKSKGLIKD